MKGVRGFGFKGKLSPWYIGPFRVLSQKGTITFELELPSRLFQVYNVFHVSQLCKCLKVPEEPLNYIELDLELDLTYKEEPSRILAENWRRLRNRAIKYCKVQWKHHPEREAPWEKVDDLHWDYRQLFRYRVP
jgi:hypothetical protein